MLYVRKRESWPNGLSDNTEDLWDTAPWQFAFTAQSNAGWKKENKAVATSHLRFLHRQFLMLPSSVPFRMWTDVSEERITSIFRAENQPKRQFSMEIHGAISQKIATTKTGS
jgi:hypothetical protein